MPLTGPSIVGTVAAPSDRRTFAEFKAELTRPFNDSDEVTLKLAGDCLNQAIRKLNRKLWSWEVYTADNISVTSGTETYALPQPFKKPLSAYFLESGREHKRLLHVPLETLYGEYDLKHDAEPTCYTLKNVFETGQITLWPRPSSAYTLRVHYYRRTPILRNDTEPAEFPPEAEGALLAEAMYQMMRRIPGQGMLGRMPVSKRDAEQAWSELVAFEIEPGDSVGVV